MEGHRSASPIRTIKSIKTKNYGGTSIINRRPYLLLVLTTFCEAE